MPEEIITQGIPHKKLKPALDKIKQRVFKHKVVKDMLKKYEIDESELDLVPICFAKLPVSARTDHGVIYVNIDLAQDGNLSEDDHYITHELTHYCQQTTGNKPTPSAEPGKYLDSPIEQEGFRNQSKYIADTKGKEEAEAYIDDVLDFHEKTKTDKKKREDRRDSLLAIAREFGVQIPLEKTAGDVFVYTFVPKDALPIIKKNGLLSGKLLVKNPTAFNIARKTKKQRDQFKKSVEEDLSYEESSIFAESVSAFFTLPDFSKLTDKHFINKWKLIPLQINLSKLMREEPDTILLGVELAPFDDKKSKEDNWDVRRKELSLRKVEEYTKKSNKELWKHYDQTDIKHYAADVPHLLIRTPKFKIAPKFLGF